MTSELSIYLNKQLGVFLNVKQTKMKLPKTKKSTFKQKLFLYDVIFYQIPIYVFKNFLRSTLSKAMFSILHYKTRDTCLFWDHPFTIFRKTDISYPLIRTHKKC